MFEILQYLWTPLHFAACNSQLDCVKELIAEGAKVNLQDKAGETPLHVAFYAVRFRTKKLTPQWNRINCVKALIRRGADPNIRNINGQTVLSVAIACDQRDCVEYLRKHGSNFSSNFLTV